MARCSAMYAYWALRPMKRSCFRGISSLISAASRFGRPRTWLRMPKSAYAWEKVMPDLAWYSESDTSSRVFPRQLVSPMPVTTTRRSAAMTTTLRPVRAAAACRRLPSTVSDANASRPIAPADLHGQLQLWKPSVPAAAAGMVSGVSPCRAGRAAVWRCSAERAKAPRAPADHHEQYAEHKMPARNTTAACACFAGEGGGMDT
mmetsp:Transcript_100574/g.284901  ORF Transcript_100574/g.284901 Transcript_100574/m.284901 type:complete len:203 (+) Transcript_100574:1222-1830(+)